MNNNFKISGENERRNARRIIHRPSENIKLQETKKNMNIPIELDSKGFYPVYDNYENDKSKHSLDVGFLIVATNKYDVFVEPLIRSIEKYVLPNNNKFYHIFSDKDLILPFSNYKVLPIEHKPFPYPTLYRFHFFSKYFSEIKGDQLIYIDADTLITNNIGTEILCPITVTQHCGYVGRNGTFETRPQSMTYVDITSCKNYYGGGFYSLSRNEFYSMMSSCINMIDSDNSKGIIPLWHDESALNKYMSDIKPDRVLSPSYHYPENVEHIYNLWGGKDKYECKILLLSKDHKEIRE